MTSLGTLFSLPDGEVLRFLLTPPHPPQDPQGLLTNKPHGSFPVSTLTGSRAPGAPLSPSACAQGSGNCEPLIGRRDPGQGDMSVALQTHHQAGRIPSHAAFGETHPWSIPMSPTGQGSWTDPQNEAIACPCPAPPGQCPPQGRAPLASLEKGILFLDEQFNGPLPPR